MGCSSHLTARCVHARHPRSATQLMTSSYWSVLSQSAVKSSGGAQGASQAQGYSSQGRAKAQGGQAEGAQVGRGKSTLERGLKPLINYKEGVIPPNGVVSLCDVGFTDLRIYGPPTLPPSLPGPHGDAHLRID